MDIPQGLWGPAKMLLILPIFHSFNKSIFVFKSLVWMHDILYMKLANKKKLLLSTTVHSRAKKNSNIFPTEISSLGLDFKLTQSMTAWSGFANPPLHPRGGF